MSKPASYFNFIAAISLIGLTFLCLGWELRWAPLRPGGSWMALKAFPLLAPLFGILRGQRYTHQWVTLLATAYFIEGAVRTATDQGLSSRLALTETVLSFSLFAGAIMYARAISDASSRP